VLAFPVRQERDAEGQAMLADFAYELLVLAIGETPAALTSVASQQ
jgi:hypothetical protein